MTRTNTTASGTVDSAQLNGPAAGTRTIDSQNGSAPAQAGASVPRAASPARGKAGLPVVFDGRYIQDRYHGIGRYAFELLSELTDLLPDQRFTLLRDPSLANSRFDWSTFETRSNARVLSLKAAPFSLREQLALPLSHAVRHSSVYHTPYFALPWLLTGRSLTTVHDCIFERDARYMPHRSMRLYYRLLMAASLARSQAVFVPSQATARDVRRFYRMPKRKLVITPEAADRHFRPISDTALLDATRRRYDLPGSFILAVGARRPHKNFGFLVRAVCKLQEAQLVFVGEADERFRDDAAALHPQADRVRFLGKVPEQDLPVLYNLATVFACPSFIEGFGLPVLEAMACGTPVVCSSIPVFKEVAGEAALMADPRDAQAWAALLDRVLGSEELRQKMSSAGLRRAGQFDWKRAACAVATVYEEMGI